MHFVINARIIVKKPTQTHGLTCFNERFAPSSSQTENNYFQIIQFIRIRLITVTTSIIELPTQLPIPFYSIIYDNSNSRELITYNQIHML